MRVLFEKLARKTIEKRSPTKRRPILTKQKRIPACNQLANQKETRKNQEPHARNKEFFHCYINL